MFQIRQEADRLRHAQAISTESADHRQVRVAADCARHAAANQRRVQTVKVATTYDPHSFVAVAPIGTKTKQCPRCNALKFPEETPSLCCHNGKVNIPLFPPPPQQMVALYTSKEFLSHIRSYNSAFAMTSMGFHEAKVAGWNPTFKIQGQVCHLIGSLNPLPGESPSFMQIFFLDNQEDQLRRRQEVMPGLRHDILQCLSTALQENNSFVHVLQHAHEFVKNLPANDIKIVLNSNKRPAGEHERRFNLPQSSEIAILMPNEPLNKRDIVLHKRDGGLMRISELHRAYDPLQYPLLFPHGTEGWTPELKTSNGTKKVTMLQYYAYHLQDRNGTTNYLLKSKRLFQQFLVDSYCKIETERLQYLLREQQLLRVDSYADFRDSLLHGDGDSRNIGQRVILPATYTGGPRFMHERQQDALGYVREYGKPDIFLTFTTNTKWPEITENIDPNEVAHDRPDIVSRVFRLKVKQLINLITKDKVFGTISAWLYSVEYQKRGLPHIHALLWLHPDDTIHPPDIDRFVSAEIPDPQQDPELHQLVLKHMIHGPCGIDNPHSPCMRDGRCTKKFPKVYTKHTQLGDDGYPKYRRRTESDGGQTANVGQHTVNNSWVVPYNPWLLRQMKAHLNVELCMSIQSIKYVLKYITKGSDQAMYTLQQTEDRRNVNEISDYQHARYVGSQEAVWRIFQFPIQEHFPPVMQLSVHLENGQRIYFREDNAHKAAESGPPRTTLTEFFKLCQDDAFAKTLLYQNVPKYYTWNSSQKSWIRRKRGSAVYTDAMPQAIFQAPALGRVYMVSPKQGECYFLRLLLHHVKGPTSFDALKTVHGITHETFKNACIAFGLLENDQCFQLAIQEATETRMPQSLRELLAVILVHCSPTNAFELWETNKNAFAEDILNRHRTEQNNPMLEYNNEIYNAALVIIENLVLRMSGCDLSTFTLPTPNRIIGTEMSAQQSMAYDVEEQRKMSEEGQEQLTTEQRSIFDTFMKLVNGGTGGIMFLDAMGGAGKTFLVNLILSTVRSQGKIALATASSGIAATLLQGGRTLHSTFKIPLNLDRTDSPMCNIKKGTNLAKIIINCAAIIIDEAPMSHKKVFEALDRTLQDIKANEQPMGGIPVLMCGDFRQILPVIPGGTRSNIVNASVKTSYLWSHVQVVHLHTNMRALMHGDQDAEQFSTILRSIGNGQYSTIDNEHTIVLNNNLVNKFCNSLDELMVSVFPNMEQNAKDHSWLAERCILAPLNCNVDNINQSLMNSLPGPVQIYRSIDSAMDDNQQVHLPVEYLNTLRVSGMPHHILALKEGSPIMILRSLDPPKITNGTRLIVKRLRANIIEAEITTGPFKNELVLIPRLPLISNESSTIPFQFKRLQFPVAICFAMTINKSQGQTFEKVGLDLNIPVFTHGQLYVGLSRVGSAQKLAVLCQNRQTRNVVFHEAV